MKTNYQPILISTTNLFKSNKAKLVKLKIV